MLSSTGVFILMYAIKIAILICLQISCSSSCIVSQFTFDTADNQAHTRTGGSMVTLTPIDRFSQDEIFQTPYMHYRGISVVVITVNKFPVNGLFMNNQTLDVRIVMTILILKSFSIIFEGIYLMHTWYIRSISIFISSHDLAELRVEKI